MSRLLEILVAAFFGLFFGLPLVVAAVLGPSDVRFENRKPKPLPKLEARSLIDTDFYREIEEFANDRFPLRSRIIRQDSRIDYFLFGDSPSPKVLVCEEGWLFLKSTLTSPCESELGEADALESIVELAELCRDNGIEFRLFMAPNKSSIYPEYLGSAATHIDACAAQRRPVLRQELERLDLPGYVDLWEVIGGLKSEEGEPFFPPLGRHWDSRGGLLLAEQISESLLPGSTNPAWVQVKDGAERAELPYRFMYLQFKEARRKHSLERPGVITDPPRVLKMDAFRRPKEYRSRSTGAPLYPGRTVVLHDSFMVRSEEFLAAHLEQVTFVNWEEFAYPGALEANLAEIFRDADTLVVEIVEDRRFKRVHQLRKNLPALEKVLVSR